MNLTDTETLKFLRGTPIFIEDVCAVFPAKLGEIIDLGYDTFQHYLSCITMVKPTFTKKEEHEIQKAVADLSDFQYLLLLATLDVNISEMLKGAFQFFCHEPIIPSLEEEKIYIGPLEEQRALGATQFYDVQRVIRKMCFIAVDEEEIIIDDDDPPFVRRMKMQMRVNREKVRRAKEKEMAQAKSDMKLSDLIGSLTVNNCNLNMVNIWDLTYYAFHDQLKRMGWRDQFNINQSAALAGAKMNQSQLKHWMRSIASSDK